MASSVKLYTTFCSYVASGIIRVLRFCVSDQKIIDFMKNKNFSLSDNTLDKLPKDFAEQYRNRIASITVTENSLPSAIKTGGVATAVIKISSEKQQALSEDVNAAKTDSSAADAING